MLIATLSVGDALITLVGVVPLAKEDMGNVTYNLTFTDIPTDKSYTKSYVSENDALHAIAAWIAADDGEGFPTIKRVLNDLRNDPAMKGQLP